MYIEALAIPDVKLITPKIFRDGRGFFSETYSKRACAEAGIAHEFIQDNQSLSATSGTVRGLHFQAPPYAQGKLVRVTRGSVLDVAVDIRVGSPSFGRHVSAILSADNWTQIWVPPGFAHGFCTMEPDTEVLYKVTAYYAPSHDFGLKWDDPALAIAWPVALADATVSDKDGKLPPLAAIPKVFQYFAT